MSTTPDLHPDDTVHRRDVVAEFRRIRLAAGLRQAPLSAVHYASPSFVSALEHRPRPDPLVVVVQRHARAVGYVADLVLHGIDMPTTADMRTYATVAATSPNPDVVDDATRSLCLERLIAARRRAGWSRVAAAKRLGVAYATLCQIEADRHAPLLSTYQRYARALGGRLTVELRPVDAVCEAAA